MLTEKLAVLSLSLLLAVPTLAASSETVVLMKIHSTRTLTAHLSLGYNQHSLNALGAAQE